MNRNVSASMREAIDRNWRAAVDDVRQAAIASGRQADEVRIVGVSKYVDGETTAALIESGCHDLGEARPQQLVDKAAELSRYPDVRWHLIGSLQRNKVRRTLAVASTVHSIDSIRLLQFVDQVADELKQRPDVLLEVNISGDENKHGFQPAELLRSVEDLLAVRSVRIVGLMGMAGLNSSREEARREFSSLRTLRDQLACDSGLALSELSMGMSGDFVDAIAEGATMVRIGSRLFAGIDDQADR